MRCQHKKTRNIDEIKIKLHQLDRHIVDAFNDYLKKSSHRFLYLDVSFGFIQCLDCEEVIINPKIIIESFYSDSSKQSLLKETTKNDRK
jgi:hypothetical protein